MGIFSWFEKLSKDKIETATLAMSLDNSIRAFRNLTNIMMDRRFVDICKDVQRKDPATMQELMHMRTTVLNTFGDNQKHVLAYEKKTEWFGWLPYHCQRLCLECEMLAKELHVVFPERATYVDDLNEDQGFMSNLIACLMYHRAEIGMLFDVLICTYDGDTSCLNNRYSDWRKLPRYNMYELLYTWPLYSKEYKLIDLVLNRGPFTPKSNGISGQTKLSDISSNPTLLNSWRNTQKGSAIINGFLPQIGIFVGDMLNLMEYKRNEYHKTEVEWVKCKMEQLRIKQSNSNDQQKIAHLQALINQYAEQMTRLQAEIEKYQNYRGE